MTLSLAIFHRLLSISLGAFALILLHSCTHDPVLPELEKSKTVLSEQFDSPGDWKLITETDSAFNDSAVARIENGILELNAQGTASASAYLNLNDLELERSTANYLCLELSFELFFWNAFSPLSANPHEVTLGLKVGNRYLNLKNPLAPDDYGSFGVIDGKIDVCLNLWDNSITAENDQGDNLVPFIHFGDPMPGNPLQEWANAQIAQSALGFTARSWVGSGGSGVATIKLKGIEITEAN